MKYVQLSTQGPHGMAHQVAREQMGAAKKRCGSAGGLSLTRPDHNGRYYAMFENDQHAGAFTGFLDSHRVQYTMTDSLPEGQAVRQRAQDPMIDLTGAVAAGMQKGAFSRLIFRKRGR